MNRRRIAAGIAIVAIAFCGNHATALQSEADSLAPPCPPSADIASINRDLRLSFESDPTRGARVCTEVEGSADLTLLEARVYRALLAMRRLEFDTPLPWTEDPPYRWMVKTITGIRLRADIESSFCCDPSDSVNIRTTGLGMAAPAVRSGKPSNDFVLLEEFMAQLVHETRHRNGFPHTCGARDNTIEQLGGWGAQHEFHIWIADHTAPEFLTPAERQAIRGAARAVCSRQFCNARCAGVEESEYDVMAAAVSAIALGASPAQTILVSDRTVGFPCETGKEAGLIVGDCNGMRTAGQSPQQVIAALRRAMPVVTQDMADSFMLGAAGSSPLERTLDLPGRQIVWGPSSGKPLPEEGAAADFAVYPSRVGFNADHSSALLYLGVKARSGRAFGEYVYLTGSGAVWKVEGRARVWETSPQK